MFCFIFTQNYTNMRVLTKSRFKLGLECPNKLFYTNKKEEYANTKSDNPFLQALASGGFQVEELARLHFPDGILIEDSKDPNDYKYIEKVEHTNALLKQENVVIFEAAFMFENLFIRVDILEKIGNQINLIEVKAKSFNSSNGLSEFANDKLKIDSKWKAYLFDVAFQQYVIKKSFPDYLVTPYLMLADKDKSTSVDGLNQMFRIKKNSGNRTGIVKIKEQIENLNIEKDSVLTKIDVSTLVDKISSGEEQLIEEFDFEDAIQILAKAYQEDRFFDYDLKFNACKKCEFKKDETKPHLKSGFENCFSKKLNWTEDDFKAPNAFEIWDFRRWKYLTDNNKLKLIDIQDAEFGDLKKNPDSITRVERQLIQKHKAIEKDFTPELRKKSLKAEIENWKFPLNFIDFEASTVALPFYAGQKPYEKVVFQFSHHIYNEDGSIEHANEYINVEAGVFPNFEFVRALKKALSHNEGTVFQYSPYENSTLNQIKVQLEASNEADKETLITFIKTLTTPPKDKDYEGEKWNPSRGMIDLCEVIKAYYYNPYTKGSNSIKLVLPAIFKTSNLIRQRYSKPIGEINLSSKNFGPQHLWLTFDEKDEVIDPYKILGKPFEEWNEDFERMTDIDEINNGGAALTAYGLTQYTDMSPVERNKLSKSLLKYCELDTLAMVMIYEHLNEIREA
jgi:hypothetical protein